MNSVNLRIKFIRTELKLSQTDFGKRLGLGRSYISAIELGQRTVKDRLIFEICREFGISEKWLRIGEGDMYAPKAHPTKVKSMLEMFDQLDNLQQNAVINLMKSMITEQ